LPITGLELNAKKANQSVIITWSTLTEKGTSHFIIEKTVDGKVFEEIGKVQAIGSSSSKQSYHFTDNNPVSGNNIYRIKSIDFNGYAEYSNMIAVSLSTGGSIMVYPNPADNYISILNSKADLKIRINSSTGKVVKTTESASDQIDISGLSPGVYLLKTSEG